MSRREKCPDCGAPMSRQQVICDACGPPMMLVALETTMKPFAIALGAAAVLFFVLRGAFDIGQDDATVASWSLVALITLASIARGVVLHRVRLRAARRAHRFKE